MAGRRAGGAGAAGAGARTESPSLGALAPCGRCNPRPLWAHSPSCPRLYGVPTLHCRQAGFPPYFPVLKICSHIPWRSQPISRPLGSSRSTGWAGLAVGLRRTGGRGQKARSRRGTTELFARGCVSGGCGRDGGRRRQELPWAARTCGLVCAGGRGVAQGVWRHAWGLYMLPCEPV